MITAKEAKRKILENPTFERKLELYKEVSEIIDEAVFKGSKYFSVTEEQHLALDKEILDKGYKRSGIQILITGLGSVGGTHPYTYNI